MLLLLLALTAVSHGADLYHERFRRFHHHRHGVARRSGCGVTLDAAPPLSIVALGDSVSSGEGIAFGYVFDPASLSWTGGVTNPQWSGPFQACHQSTKAYPVLVAEALNASITHLSCSGATIPDGIEGPDTSLEGDVPAQFGKVDVTINPRYVAAKPDVVLLTVGANDVGLIGLFSDCFSEPASCVIGNPNAPSIRNRPDLATMETDLARLIGEIRAQAERANNPVKIVVTNYAIPFSATRPQNDDCDDEMDLPTKLFLIQEMEFFNSRIEAVVGTFSGQNVHLADVRNGYGAYSGTFHGICSSDPHIYGQASIEELNDESTAQLHPTPAGQEVLKNYVLAVVQNQQGK